MLPIEKVCWIFTFLRATRWFTSKNPFKYLLWQTKYDRNCSVQFQKPFFCKLNTGHDITTWWQLLAKSVYFLSVIWYIFITLKAIKSPKSATKCPSTSSTAFKRIACFSAALFGCQVSTSGNFSISILKFLHLQHFVLIWILGHMSTNVNLPLM